MAVILDLFSRFVVGWAVSAVNDRHVTIKALGMYCEEECPMKVRYALADIPAVYELGFDVTTESIFVSYDKKLGLSRDVTQPMIIAAVSPR